MSAAPARPARDRPPGGSTEVAIAAAAGVFVAAASLVWIAAGAAGWLAHGRWPRVGLGAAAVAVVRLVRHLGEPAVAWPPYARTQLGSTSMFWASLGVEVALIALGAAAARRVLASRRRELRRRARRPGMAEPGELRQALSIAARRRRAGQIRPSLSGPQRPRRRP